MKISDVARFYLDTTDKRDHMTAEEAADALDTIRAELSAADMANMPDDVSPESFAAAYNQIVDAERPWYAVMTGPDDDDWSCGSYDREAAEAMLTKQRDIYPNSFIAVIVNDVCVDEIY